MHKLEIKQPKFNENNDSFFYDGLIADCGKYSLIAAGIIEIWCSKHKELCYDCKPRNCCCLKEPETDEDVNFGSEEDERFWFNHNNWFEFIGKDQKDDPNMEVEFNYDEAIDTLYKLANNIEL